MTEPYTKYARRGRRNKYGAKRVGSHASKKEHYRSIQLQTMQRAGLIADLREQVNFMLLPPQYVHTCKQGKSECADCSGDGFCRADKPCGRHNGETILAEKACRYRADFVYTDLSTGEIVVEDTKGVLTPEYKIKRKLMLYIHGIRVKET